ncbi:MAG: hypothetical protein M3N93_10220 [Acidobacteriota bacterium]|nr:hypothetical protein [Acidobacteriota bacterium]
MPRPNLDSTRTVPYHWIRMHEGGALDLREVVEKHQSALVAELKERFDAEVRQSISRALAEERLAANTRLVKACEAAKTSQLESLNQLVRRLRSSGASDIPGLLAEGLASYARKLVVLTIENGQAHAPGGVVDVASSPAIASAIESRDPVVALATPSEISPLVARLLHDGEDATDRKAYLFPLAVRQSVVAMVVALNVEQAAPVEMVCEVAGLRLEALESTLRPVVPALAAAASGNTLPPPSTQDIPASATSGARSWSELTPDDQKLHLQAQRMARVRVAEMRLYHPDDLGRGVETSNIYGSLQNAIDAARTQFLQNFLSKSPTMVDYLHLEIMRTLAHDDDSLLGHSYPGPMV